MTEVPISFGQLSARNTITRQEGTQMRPLSTSKRNTRRREWYKEVKLVKATAKALASGSQEADGLLAKSILTKVGARKWPLTA